MSETPGNREIGGQGQRIHWLWAVEDSESLRHYSVFLSRDLAQKYEEEMYALHFDEGLVSPIIVDEFEIEFEISITRGLESLDQVLQSQPIQNLLRIEEISLEDPSEAVLPAELRANIQSNIVSSIFGKIFRNVPSVNDTLDGFEREEDDIRDKKSDLRGSNDRWGYAGPLFYYEVADQSSTEIILQREAPINIVWQRMLGETGIALSNRMKTNGWGSVFNLSRKTRHAIVRGNKTRLRTHGDEAAKRSGYLGNQWHVRMVEIPPRMDSMYTVAGNGHHDPRFEHGQVRKWFQNLQDPDWKYSTARQETSEDWFDWGFERKTLDAGNADNFDSSDGKIDVIWPI